jgi:MauM/NapG family ferredoxin protein
LLPDYLRPPGALPESALIAVCERCHKCRDACPQDAILPLGPAYGDADGTPAILPRGEPCRMCEEFPCIAACPSGALRQIPSAGIRLGTARLDPSLCWAAKGQPCDYCVSECPLGESALRWNGDRPEVVADDCNGCGRCVHICAADPAALRVVPYRAT